MSAEARVACALAEARTPASRGPVGHPAGREKRRGRAHGMCRWGGVWWEEIDKDRRGIFFLRVQNRVCCSVQMYLEGEKF